MQQGSRMNGRSSRRMTLGLVLLLGFVLRAWRLGAQSLWYDETVSAYLASQPLAQLIRHTSMDIHPPLYYILLRYWSLGAGRSEFALAFFSLAFGWLHVPVVYALGRKVAGERIGLLAAFLTAISPFGIWYSQEVRMYTLGSFLGMVGLWALVHVMDDERPTFHAVLWVASGVLGLYVLYYFGFLLVAEAVFVVVWLAVRMRRATVGRRELATWVAAFVALPILYLPWAPIAWRQATNPPVPPWRSFVGAWRTFETAWSALCLGQSVEPRAVAWVLAIFGVLYLLGLMRGRRSPWVHGLLFFYTFGPLALLYLISLRLPLYHPRYMALYAGPFPLVVAEGLGIFSTRHRWKAMLWGLAILVIVGASGYSIYRYHFDPRYAADDYRSGVRLIQEQWAPGDAVLIDAGYVYTAFDYYFHDPIGWQGRLTEYRPSPKTWNGVVVVETGTVGGDPNLGWGQEDADFYPMSEEETTAAMQRLFETHPRVWLLRAYDTVADPHGVIRRWLSAHAVLLWDRLLTGETNARVQLWRAKTPPAPPTAANPHRYPSAGLTLLSWKAMPESASVRQGGKAGVWTWWRSSGQTPVVGVSLRLLDGSGSLWAQHDVVPEGPLRPGNRWGAGEVLLIPLGVEVPWDAPPGKYDLSMVLYRRSDGAPFEDATGGSASPLILGAVQVERSSRQRRPTWWKNRPDVSADGIELVGWRMDGSGAVLAGKSVPWEALWASTGDGTARSFRLTLRSGGDELAARTYPLPSGLPRGSVERSMGEFHVPGSVRDGSYDLYLEVLDETGKPLPLRRWGWLPVGSAWKLGKVSVRGRKIETTVPPMQHRVGARFGGKFELLGYDLSPEKAKPGEEFDLKLYWRSLAPAEKSYKVFVHLVGPDGRLYGQRDSYPKGGSLPTSAWVPGEVVSDEYRVPVSDNALPGHYELRVGMYLEASGTRLPVTSGGDFVALPVEVTGR